MRKTWWIVVIVLMLGMPQRTSAQIVKQKLFEVDGVIGVLSWSADSRWIAVFQDPDENMYYELKTHTLQQERPQIMNRTQTISDEERTFFHVADKTNISISPNGRYMLYDSSDPLPPTESEDEKIDREVMKIRPTYLADRKKRTYTQWGIAGGLNSTWWSDDSSGVLVWVNVWEGVGFAGYVTGFQEDVTQFRNVNTSEFKAEGKTYFYYESFNGDGDNMYAFVGHKLLITASDEATGLKDDRVIRSLISLDVHDPSKSRIVEYDIDLLPFPRSSSERSLLIGGAGFGADADRYIWVLSIRGLLLYDLQSKSVRMVDASIVPTTMCCQELGEFSPDGKLLVYHVFDDDNYRSTMYLVDLEQYMN